MNWHRVVDRLCFPFVALVSDETAIRFGLTPLDHERILAVSPLCRGLVLDVGCGNNVLVSRLGQGVGMDIIRRPGVDVGGEAVALPFGNETFDTVTFVASLNHIVDRQRALREAHRVLCPEGRVIITMITPFVGTISHPIRRPYDPDQHDREFQPGEMPGLTRRTVSQLLVGAGFRLVQTIPFVLRLNRVYVGIKPSADQ